jgi:hypothetical protein
MPISFEKACQEDNVEMVNRALFSQSPKVPIEIRNDKSLSGLMIASAAGSLTVCKLFVEKNVT